MRRKEGEVVEMVSCPLLVHPFELELTPLRLEIVSTGADWGRGEARASQKGSETTRALGLISGNKMCPGLESRIFSLTLHRTLHELVIQARQRSLSLAQTRQPVMNMGNKGFGEKHSRVLAMNRQLIFRHRSLKRTRQKPGILKLTDCSLGCHVQLFETPWTAACQASLSFTVSQSLLKFMSTELMMLTISSSTVLFSSCLQSFPASGSFQKSQLFVSGGQSIEASASASVLPVNIQGWFSLRIDWFNLLAVQGTLKSLLQHHSSNASGFFMTQLSHLYMSIEKP